MSIPTSTKHRLLLEYNRKREQKYNDYMHSTQKEDVGRTDLNDRDDVDSVDLECRALYKKLAEDHHNKDV